MRILPLDSPRTTSKLAWIEGGNKQKTLLTVAGIAHLLHYGKLSGNVDAAIITAAAKKTMFWNTGLRILFELKKKVTHEHHFQACAQLLLANILSQSHKPVVVLTDLRDVWQLLWLDKTTIWIAHWDSRAEAIATIDLLIKEAALHADSPVIPSGQSSGIQDLPDPIAKRAPLPPFTDSSAGAADAGLADLVGMLPDAEMGDAHATVMVQQLLKLPVFSDVAQSLSACSLHESHDDNPLTRMYS